MVGRHDGSAGGSAGLITRAEIGGILRSLDLKMAKTAKWAKWIALEGLVICVLLAITVLG